MVDKIEVKSEETGALAPEENSPASGENSTAEEITQEQRPGWLPEKFGKPEDLAQAYSELEKKFTQQSQNNTDSVSELVESAGMKMEDLSSEYEQSGQLSEESYEKLSKVGVDRKYVDAYIKGQEAIVLQYQSDVFNVAGGRDNYMSLIDWAAKNLTADEINSFNTIVNAGDLEAAKMTVKGLTSRFQDAEGREPVLVRGAASGSGESVFRSTAELKTAMSDPRYKNDPAYRDDVIQRLSRSNIF